MNKEKLIEWMDSTGKTHQWLADKCGVKPKTIRSWRSDRPVPAKAVLIINQLIAEEEMANYQAQKIPQNLVLEFEDSEFDKLEKKALEEGKTTREWAKDTLNDAAGIREFMAKVAEDPETYNGKRY